VERRKKKKEKKGGGKRVEGGLKRMRKGIEETKKNNERETLVEREKNRSLCDTGKSCGAKGQFLKFSI
jgi:hypothetical protein